MTQPFPIASRQATHQSRPRCPIAAIPYASLLLSPFTAWLVETTLSALPHCTILEALVFQTAAPSASSPCHHKLRHLATDSKVALALRVLEGCCLLCWDCTTTAHWYNAIKVHSPPLLP
ncbi:hypothetical protein E2562_024580 [Oryza meyeriana var. granulata]|uniref:Uncharacterized protein n=1 Tax=Oryza meyeriana var. granulata TaxID=110450 RepID=A0A6G1CT96_9ORYZ|nr:hypothetical protein E2562_024580 [Oryza meyeriana var. granulata]